MVAIQGVFGILAKFAFNMKTNYFESNLLAGYGGAAFALQYQRMKPSTLDGV